MDDTFSFCLLMLFLLLMGSSVASFDGPLYDSTAYTECKMQPEAALYGGGIINDQASGVEGSLGNSATTSSGVYSPSFILHDLSQGTIYCFSSWVKIEGAGSALIRASLKTEKETYDCIGTVLAKHGCWSFLKGGFVLDSPSQLSILFFQNTDDRDVNIEIASSSLQPFSVQQWRTYQQYIINTKRKRAVTVHVANEQGRGCKDKDHLGNLPYQRFNAVVFENELKWYATEPEQGKTNYTIADQMLQFVRANQITARGHNIFWEDPKYTPPWVRNLTGNELQSAVNSRIQSLMSNTEKSSSIGMSAMKCFTLISMSRSSGPMPHCISLKQHTI
ncbi:putative endo-1 4-beta-xylanase C [Prunus yedoensis var. nudiflora]|uniref:Putative endo-1 4-beta-xylanase C n=1 Tax=Prunus yedoensis var. nudiflora TaxID=2094558 RepID=A0A314YNP5_PRUYE|nr:putative endo-1 4-beta-xylanase C [Prunus yedoensis var. nudiflora]